MFCMPTSPLLGLYANVATAGFVCQRRHCWVCMPTSPLLFSLLPPFRPGRAAPPPPRSPRRSEQPVGAAGWVLGGHAPGAGRPTDVCVVCHGPDLSDTRGEEWVLLECDALDCKCGAHPFCAREGGHPSEGGPWDAFFCSEACVRASREFFRATGHRRVRSGMHHGRCYVCGQLHTSAWHTSPMGARTLCDGCHARYVAGDPYIVKWFSEGGPTTPFMMSERKN